MRPHEEDGVRTSEERPSTATLVIALGCVFVAFAFALASQYVETRGSAAYQCAFAAPEGAALSERSLVYSRVSAWPIGRSCTWLMEVGGTTTVQSDWTATVVAVVATGASLVLAGVFAHRARRRGGAQQWWWPALTLAAPVASWLILITTASVFIYTPN